MPTLRRAAPTLGATGLVASVVVAVAAGRAYTGTSVPPSRWWGLVAAHGYRDGDPSWWAVVLWAGITVLTLSWVGLVVASHRGAVTRRQGWTFAGLWALPLALGPPAVSKDVYAYAASSVLLHHGGDIYRDGPSALASVRGADAARALAAVDPRWRDSPSPYGPATTAVQWLAGVTGDPVTAVIVLRVVAVLAVAALAWLCTSLADDARRPQVLVLVALNPLLLVHGLSAAHVEALMCAFLVAALVAARRGVWWAAVVLAVLAGLVKAPALLAVPVLLAWHVLGTGDVRERWRRGGTDLGVALLTTAAVSFAVPDGWGWLRNLTTPGRGQATSSVTGHLASLAHAVAPAGKTVVTALGALAAVAILAWLAWTFRRRPPSESLGWGLLAVAFLAPVTYPWYALWGLVCLLPSVRGRALVVLVGLSALEAGWSIPGGSGSVTGPLVLVVLVGTLVGVVVGWRRVPAQSPTSRSSRPSALSSST